MLKNDLKSIINECLEVIIKNDIYLLNHDVHEQSFSAVLVGYLKEKIPKSIDGGWDIDVEYNRNLDDPKKLSTGNVKPDIIIHRRGKNNNNGIEDNNLLIIEIKKNPKYNEEVADIKKIQRFIDEKPYYYKFGLFISIYPNLQVKFNTSWFERRNI